MKAINLKYLSKKSYTNKECQKQLSALIQNQFNWVN